MDQQEFEIGYLPELSCKTIKSFSRKSTNCSNKSLSFEDRLYKKRGSLNSTMTKEREDLLSLPLQKIAEAFKINPFFKHKIKALSKRKEQLQTKINQNGGYSQEGQSISKGKTILIRYQNKQEWTEQLQKINLILQMCKQ